MPYVRLNIRVTEKINELIKKYPELRIYQLLGNVIPPKVAERYNNDLYYLSDEDLLGYLEEYAKLGDGP